MLNANGADRDLGSNPDVLLPRALPALAAIFRAANLSDSSAARLACVGGDAVVASLGLALAATAANDSSFQPAIVIQVKLRRSVAALVPHIRADRLAETFFDRSGGSWELADFAIEVDVAETVGREIEITVGRNLISARLRIPGRAANAGAGSRGCGRRRSRAARQHAPVSRSGPPPAKR